MKSTHSLPAALRLIRDAREMSQEDFSDPSSRTYISALERGLQSPTIGKLEELCKVMEVHPLTLLTVAYAGTEESKADALFGLVKREISVIAAAEKSRRRK